MEVFQNSQDFIRATVSSLYTTGQLTDCEKFRLEEMIDSSNDKILKIFTELTANRDMERLPIELLKIVHELRKHPGRILIPLGDRNQEAHSPLGTFLLEKKKQHSKNRQLQLILHKTDCQEDIENVQN